MREAVCYAKNMDVKIIPYELAEDMEHTKQLIESVQPGQKVAVFIGPEGGFEESEIQEALDAGIEPVTLGRRILRTETAGLTVLSWLMYHLER
jgi:16S rRNA (uracil1498-N3)-methyltransferase